MVTQTLFCHGFSARQIASLRHLIQREDGETFEISSSDGQKLVPQGLHLYNCTKPDLITQFVLASELSRDSQDRIFEIAVVPCTPDLREKIYQHGFMDYMMFPFVMEEVMYRLSVALEKISSNLKIANFAKDELVQKACEFMFGRLDQIVHLDELTIHCSTNRNTLNNRFMSELGQSPISWHREKRLIRTSELLTEGRDTITDIAQKMGFADSNNFSTAFKKRFGQSPRNYRKMK